MTTDQKPWRAEMPDHFEEYVDAENEDGLVGEVFVECYAPGSVLALVTKCNTELDAARAERDESRALLLQSEQERNETRLALIDAGIPATAPAPPGYAGCIVFGVGERIRSLANERDAARARIAELEAFSENLQAFGRTLVQILTYPGHAMTRSEWDNGAFLCGYGDADMPDWDNMEAGRVQKMRRGFDVMRKERDAALERVKELETLTVTVE